MEKGLVSKLNSNRRLWIKIKIVETSMEKNLLEILQESFSCRLKIGKKKKTNIEDK